MCFSPFYFAFPSFFISCASIYLIAWVFILFGDLVFPFLIVGVSGTSGESSSSKPCPRWDIYLNRPPAAEPEPASSTSDHPKEVVDQALSEAAEDRILYRLRPFPQANADKLLMEEARAIAQLKERADCRSNGAIGFRRGLLARKKMQFIIGLGSQSLRIGKLSILPINCLRCLRNCVARMPTHPLSTFKKRFLLYI